MIIDTHIHLNMKDYNDDLDQLLENAKLAGVEKMIVVGMDNYHNKKAVELSKKYPNLYASVGIHPVDVGKLTLDDVMPYVNHKKVVAIGETGIDLYWNKDNLELQQQEFIKQIELAIKLDKPIIIHTRNSFNEAFECVKPYIGRLRGVFHSFSSNLEDAKKCIDAGFYIGIGGVVTFKKALELQEIVTHIDLSHMLIETDGPFLTPHPYRGKRNEPAYNKLIAEKIAELKGVSFEEVCKITTQNANNLFGLESL